MDLIFIKIRLIKIIFAGNGNQILFHSHSYIQIHFVPYISKKLFSFMAEKCIFSAYII